MLLDFDSTYLEFVRGDSFDLPLLLNEGTREYPIYCAIPENCKLEVFMTLPNQPIEDAIIKKTINAGMSLSFSLTPQETSRLNIGKYYFTVRYIKEAHTQTIVNNKLLYVTGTPKPEDIHES